MPANPDAGPGGEAAQLRLDMLLWRLRFVRSRSLAQKLVAGQHIRVNGVRAVKPHHPVRAGDTLTFPLGPHVHVVTIVHIPVRRGPASEARACYAGLRDASAAPPQA